jgi:hypothetical protein
LHYEDGEAGVALVESAAEPFPNCLFTEVHDG